MSPLNIPSPPARDRASIVPGMALSLLVLVLVQVGFGGGLIGDILGGALVDTDAYMRLNRVRLLWETLDWFDSTYPRINPPDGMVLHWTRPMDVVLILGALPLTPFVGFEAALHGWAVVIGPLLQAALLFALVWAAAPLIHGPWRWLIALFSIAQPGVLGNFVFGRPDHHGLLALLLVILLGLTVRLIAEPERRQRAVWAGLLSALCLWISLEALPQVLITLTALGLIWLWNGGAYLRAILVYSAALLVGLAAAAAAEHGGAVLARLEFDRLSLAHLGLFSLNLVFWGWLSLLARRRGTLTGLARRTAWSVLGAAGVAAAIWFILPQFLANPVTREMEGVYRAVHHSGVVQLQPVLDFSPAGGFTWAGTVFRPLHWLGPVLFALPFLIYLVASRPAAEARGWILIGLGVIAFLPAGLAQVRWASHAEIFFLFPYAALAAGLVETLAIRMRRGTLSLVRPLVVIGLSVWFLVPTALSGPVDEGSPVADGAACPLGPLSAALNDPRVVGGEGAKRVLAFIDFGPEILYRTRHSVFSIPTSRYQKGFTTGYEIMTATDPERARALIAGAGVDLIVICPGSPEKNMYATPGPATTFYEMLAWGNEGGFPAFLQPLALPGNVGKSFRAFRAVPK